MEPLGWLNGYEVCYLSIAAAADWSTCLPTANWLLFVVVGEFDRALFEQLTTECLQRQPLGIFCAGPSAALLEDWFDEEIVMRAVRWEEQHQPCDYEYAPVTVADADIAEGFWFATLNSPSMCAGVVEQIICVDATGTHRDRLTKLLQLIETGWLPPDTKHDS